MAADGKIVSIKPILKWAGGKTQLLPELLPIAKAQTGRYLEPFVGGGALFFALDKPGSLISDSNPELINLYRQVADDVESVISQLATYSNDSDSYYSVRALDWEQLPQSEAAARTIYLNHTCFNGLYRVNKRGQFNVPFGRYKNPKILDADNLRAASALLQKTEIVCGDFDEVLRQHARPGDFVFLDPPYIPVSRYAEFNRYTREKFFDDDQQRVSSVAEYLVGIGCSVIITNSYHPMVFELYPGFDLEVVSTKRFISSKGSSRKADDLIVTSTSLRRKAELSQRALEYPSTRFMGSKAKLLGDIWSEVSDLGAQSALDLFSGSGVVSYMLKAQGLSVTSNDYMAMSAVFTKALVENSERTLSDDVAHELLSSSPESDHFVETTFKGLYFTDEENRKIDDIRANIASLGDEYDRAIAMMALIRACTKKRPRGIFTYVGHRYDDGRRDLQQTLEEQFLRAVGEINAAVFSNGMDNLSRWGDALTCDQSADLVYIDPPYFSPTSDNQYVRRYHFLEGLARSWQGVTIQEETKTKKFRSYPTPFSTREGTIEAFETIYSQHQSSVILVSYSSNSEPKMDEMVDLLHQFKRHVRVTPIDYRYSFGTQHAVNRNLVKEYLFLGY